MTDTGRWNIEERDDGVLAICRGGHEKSDGCDYVEYVRRDSVSDTELAAATDRCVARTIAEVEAAEDSDRVAALEARVAELEARVGEMGDALAPFAALAPVADRIGVRDEERLEVQKQTEVLLTDRLRGRDLRRAEAVLAGLHQPPTPALSPSQLVSDAWSDALDYTLTEQAHGRRVSIGEKSNAARRDYVSAAIRSAETSLDGRMRAAGMFTIAEMLGETPMTRWQTHTGVADLESFARWLDALVRQFTGMQARMQLERRAVGEAKDELYEWALAHAAATASVRTNFHAAVARQRPVLTDLLDRVDRAADRERVLTVHDGWALAALARELTAMVRETCLPALPTPTTAPTPEKKD